MTQLDAWLCQFILNINEQHCCSRTRIFDMKGKFCQKSTLEINSAAQLKSPSCKHSEKYSKSPPYRWNHTISRFVHIQHCFSRASSNDCSFQFSTVLGAVGDCELNFAKAEDTFIHNTKESTIRPFSSFLENDAKTIFKVCLFFPLLLFLLFSFRKRNRSRHVG